MQPRKAGCSKPFFTNKYFCQIVFQFGFGFRLRALRRDKLPRWAFKESKMSQVKKKFKNVQNGDATVFFLLKLLALFTRVSMVVWQ